MKYLILLSALFLVGCTTVENIRDTINASLPPTGAEKIAITVEGWAAKQSAQLSEQFSKGFPLHERASNRTQWLSEDELATVKRKTVTLKTVRARIENNDTSMKKLRGIYDSYEKKSEIMLSSIFFIDEAINRAASSFEKDIGLYLNYQSSVSRSYCENLGIDTTHMADRGGSYAISHFNCTDEAIGQALVRRKFYADNPSFESYYSWLYETTQNAKSPKDLIFTFGRSQETKKYFAHAKKSGCGDVKGVNTSLARTITYGRNPVEGYIYSLTMFKVLQSTGNGILLKSIYPDAYKSQPIFVQTNHEYADGTSFRDSGPLVCFTGKMKQYSSVLGANRKVYSFKAIPDSKKSYYFLPWAE